MPESSKQVVPAAAADHWPLLSALSPILLALLILTSFGAVVRAQTQTVLSTLRGRVRDAHSEEDLPFANVMIRGTTLGTTTDVKGYFVLLNVPAGPCSLAVSYLGYETYVRAIEDTARAEMLVIHLVPRLLQGEGITVTAYREEMLQTNEQVSRVTVSPEQLATLPSIGEVDIFRSLQLLPGISNVNDGSSGLYVRGGTPDQNLVLFDGMTIYHVDHFFGFFSAFNADAVKNVQVYKGGYPAKYGGRLSSVVSLTGKTGNRNRPEFDIGANLLSAHTAWQYPINDRTTLLLAYRRSYTDFIQSPLYEKIYDLMTGDQGGRTGPGVRPGGGGGFGSNVSSGQVRPNFKFWDFNGKLTWDPSERDIMALSLYSGSDNLDKSQQFSGTNFRFPGQETTSDFTLQTGDITRWGNIGLGTEWSRRWQERFATTLQVAGSSYFSQYDRGSNLGSMFGAQQDSVGLSRGLALATDEDNRVSDLTLRLDADWQAASRHRLEMGTQFSLFDARYQSTLNDTTSVINRSDRAPMLAAYLQDTWQLNIRSDLTVGLRANHYGPTGGIDLEPRVSLGYWLTDRWRVVGAWGRFHQYVNRIVNEDVLSGSRDFWLLADDHLKAGESEHYITGLSYETGGYLFSAEAYRKELHNILEYTRRLGPQREPGGEDQPDYFFVGDGRTRGIEFLAQRKRGLLTGWIGYTLGQVEHWFDGINDGEPFPADHDRRHEVNVVARQQIGNWTLAATWTYASGRAYTAPESEYLLDLLDGRSLGYIHVGGKNANRLPSYKRLDLSASRLFDSERWTTEVGLSVFNAYNHRNVWYREYQLDTTPITVTDVLMLGFTPTLYVQFNVK